MDSAGMNDEPQGLDRDVGPSLQITLVAEPVLTVQASGEIDLANAGDLEKALLEAAVQSPGGFVLDLSGTTYVDSAGMAAILSAYSRLRPSSGSMAIMITDGMLREIFDIVQIGLLPGMRICDDCQAAQDFVSGQA